MMVIRSLLHPRNLLIKNTVKAIGMRRKPINPVTAPAVCSLALVACWCFTSASSAQNGGTKNAVPAATRQAEIRKLVDDTFEVSKANTAAKKQAVAQKLTEMIDDPSTTSDELYAALQLVLLLQRDLGDFAAFSTAVNKLTESFEVDAAAEKTTRITEFLVACKSSTTLDPAVDEVVEMAERAARDNQFRQANELLALAEKHAKRVSATKITKSLNDIRSGVRGREQAFALLTSAQRTLVNQPNDPKANLAVGQWFAVYQSDWEQALPKLRLGSDAKWKSAAELDSKASQDDSESQLAAADAWWEVSQAATGATKNAIQSRAHGWYERYLPSVKTPLTKARVNKRIEELTAALETAPPVATVSTTTLGSSDGAVKSDLKVDQWTDLLEMVNFSEHAFKGTWQKQQGDLVASVDDAVLMFPIALEGSFELSCELTPPTDRPIVKFLFPTGRSSCGIVFNADNNAVSGLELVDGVGVKDPSAAAGTVTRPSRLAPEKRNQVQISVVQNKDRITIDARLDGKRITSWTGQSSQLSQACPYLDRMIPCPHSIGINVKGGATFHKFAVRLNRGARAFWLRDDWKNPVTQVALNPPKSIEANCVMWKGRRYLFSDQSLTFPDAQRLAAQVHGRVLTISSPEEEAFINESVKDHPIWLSGWRRENRKEWFDERNRPLKYFGKWAPNEPSMIYTEPNLRINAKKGGQAEWADSVPDLHFQAVIEWGEEYSETKSK